MYIRGIVDTERRGFTIRELLGETEYTKVMAELYGIKYEIMDGKKGA